MFDGTGTTKIDNTSTKVNIAATTPWMISASRSLAAESSLEITMKCTVTGAEYTSNPVWIDFVKCAATPKSYSVSHSLEGENQACSSASGVLETTTATSIDDCDSKCHQNSICNKFIFNSGTKAC